MPQTYGPSRLDGYDFSRIKALCDTFYVALPGNPGNGDLMAYNSQNGAWEASPGLFDLFCAHDHGGGIAVTSASPVTLTYDTETRNDASYAHIPGVAGIQVLQGGWHLVQADVSLGVSAGGTNSYTSLWLAGNGSEIEGTRTHLYTFQSGFRGSGGIRSLLELGANDVVSVRAQLSASGNTVATVADGCRITIVRLGAGGSTGTAGQSMGAGLFSFITYP